MYQKFQNHITTTFAFLIDKKILIAVSGGLDSMVLLDLMQKMNFDIAIAHCNFMLRGLESDNDQKFIENYAIQHNINSYVTQFETQNFADTHKLSIQLAARKLRYDWFYELLDTKKYDYILTAHHADDNLETFVINLLRGTGIEGLTGILEQNNLVIRPLMPFSRKEIQDYAQQNNLIWREDSSNQSDKYLRNKIRHRLIPMLKEFNPMFLDTFQKTQKNLQNANNLIDRAVELAYNFVAKTNSDTVVFDIEKLKSYPEYQTYLYYFLHKYGFSAWQDIYKLMEAQAGKLVYSEKYQLLKDRQNLILSPIKINKIENEYLIENITTEINYPIRLSISIVKKYCSQSKNSIYVDADTINFPLIIRKFDIRDIFYPLGMNGKTKKVSKFFRDEKLSLPEKEAIWLLTTNNQIVWIIGMRQDERFKITDSTKNILQISFTN